MKKLLKVTRKEKKKHNKIVILVKSKLNSIETLKSQAVGYNGPFWDTNGRTFAFF